MDAIEKAAMKQYQLDVEAGLVQPSGSSPIPGKEPATPPAKAASEQKPPTLLGSKTTATGSNADPVAAPVAKAEAATAKTSNPTRDETVGQPGEWQTVEVPAPRSVPKPEKGEGGNKNENNEGGNHYVQGADDDEGEADPEDLRGFKIVEKTYPVETDAHGDDGEGGSTGVAVFKKRKAGASKPRNIRRKL
ncbi:hypothetical protein BGX20_009384 [Mortierella sp. AD010]|nr:hypothetical protein BGX20_009384 [Mortierella sp. AD010]